MKIYKGTEHFLGRLRVKEFVILYIIWLHVTAECCIEEHRVSTFILVENKEFESNHLAPISLFLMVLSYACRYFKILVFGKTNYFYLSNLPLSSSRTVKEMVFASKL